MVGNPLLRINIDHQMVCVFCFIKKFIMSPIHSFTAMIEWKRKIRPDKEAHKHNGEALTLIYLFVDNQLLLGCLDDGWFVDGRAGVVASTGIYTSEMTERRKRENHAKFTFLRRTVE